MPELSHFYTIILVAPQWIWKRLSSGSARYRSVSSGGVRGSDVRGGGFILSGISPPHLSLVVNLHIIVWIDLDGASATTKALAAALAEAADDGGSRPITILIPSGGSGGSGTGRGDSGGGNIRDA